MWLLERFPGDRLFNLIQQFRELIEMVDVHHFLEGKLICLLVDGVPVVLSVLQETESICVLTRDIIPSTGDNTSSTGSYAHTPVLPKAIQHSYAGQAMSSAHHHLYSQQKKAGNNW